jgi:molybdate-binding protein
VGRLGRGAREELSFPRQREDYGSEARLLLEREMSEAGIEASQLPGYDTRATGHLQVAAVIAAGLADAGIASEPAARAYGLAFIPLAAEHFDLVIPPGQFGRHTIKRPHGPSRPAPPPGSGRRAPPAA